MPLNLWSPSSIQPSTWVFYWLNMDSPSLLSCSLRIVFGNLTIFSHFQTYIVKMYNLYAYKTQKSRSLSGTTKSMTWPTGLSMTFFKEKCLFFAFSLLIPTSRPSPVMTSRNFSSLGFLVLYSSSPISHTPPPPTFHHKGLIKTDWVLGDHTCLWQVRYRAHMSRVYVCVCVRYVLSTSVC